MLFFMIISVFPTFHGMKLVDLNKVTRNYAIYTTNVIHHALDHSSEVLLASTIASFNFTYKTFIITSDLNYQLLNFYTFLNKRKLMLMLMI
ncbi:hypothetical protein YC2023_020573 [Brassica napus]